MNTPIEKAIKLCGLTALAKKIGASPNQVSNWRLRGVPIEYCSAVESATNAEVTRKQFRPNDWQKIWPELAKTKKPKP